MDMQNIVEAAACRIVVFMLSVDIVRPSEGYLQTFLDTQTFFCLLCAASRRVLSSNKALPTPTAALNLAFLSSFQELAAFPH